MAINEPDFSLAQLRYFTVTAELGNMTAAARRLNISQSAISAAIMQLERQFRVQLFVRHHSKGLALTQSGERLLAEVRHFLAGADQLTEVGRSLSGNLSGSLAVGCFLTLGPFYLPRLLTDFRALYPDVRVSLVEGDAKELEDELLRGGCEVALLYGLEMSKDIQVEVLFTMAYHVLLSTDHPLARANAIRLSDLAGEPMVLLDRPYSTDYFRLIMAEAGLDPQISYRSSNFETVRALVASGHGFSLLNQRPASGMTYDGRQVVSLPILDCSRQVTIVLATVRWVRPTPRAQAFIDRCRALLGDQSELCSRSLTLVGLPRG